MHCQDIHHSASHEILAAEGPMFTVSLSSPIGGVRIKKGPPSLYALESTQSGLSPLAIERLEEREGKGVGQEKSNKKRSLLVSFFWGRPLPIPSL